MKNILCIKKATFVFLFLLCGASFSQAGEVGEIRGGELKNAYQLKSSVSCSNYKNFLGESTSDYTPAEGKKLLIVKATIGEGYSISKYDYELAASGKRFFCLSVSTRGESFDMKNPEIKATSSTDVYLLFEGPSDISIFDLKFIHNSSVKHPNVDFIKFSLDKNLPIEIKGSVASKGSEKGGASQVKSNKVGVQLLSYIPAESARYVIAVDPSGKGRESFKTGRVSVNLKKIIKVFDEVKNIDAILAVLCRDNDEKTKGTQLILISTKEKVDHKAAANKLGSALETYTSDDKSITTDAKNYYTFAMGMSGNRYYIIKLSDYCYLIGDSRVEDATKLFRGGDKSKSLYADKSILNLVNKAPSLDGVWGISTKGIVMEDLTAIGKKLGYLKLLSN